MAHYEDIIVVKDSEIKCILCKEVIPNSTEYIKTHLNSESHRALYLKRLFLQNNIILGPDKISCHICKVNFAEGKNVMSHINSEKHQNILNSIKLNIEQDGAYIEIPENIDDRASALCSICNRIFEFTHESIKNHLSSSLHRCARSIAVQPYNGIFSVEDSDDDLWCKICQIYFENYIELIFEHVDQNKEHLARLKKILHLINGEDISIENYLMDPKEDKALCRRCNMEVSCNVINIQDHIKGKKHKPNRQI